MANTTIPSNSNPNNQLINAGSTAMRASLISPQSSIVAVVIDQSSPGGRIWASIDPPATGSGSIFQLNAMFMDEFDSGITESSQPEYVGSKVVGRSEEFKSYTGTTNREVNLKFKFRVQGIGDVSAVSAIQAEVLGPAKWMDALKYPIIDGSGISRNPPAVVLIIGRLLKMRCIVTKADITWQAPWDVDSMLPYGADVDCTFTAVNDKIGNYSFGNERFRPVSNPGGGYAGQGSGNAQA